MVTISKKISYKTVSDGAQTVYIDKKSKFIANVKPVETEEDALEFLAQIKKQYSDASHNVYAYIIDENNITRYSDDGEPGGTAGMPVLDTIRKEGLVDVIVVVTRYFGGTLLGTGGLVRAYTASAKSGLTEAGIVTMTLCNTVEIKADYTLVGRIQYKISSENYILEDTAYGDYVTFKICCQIGDTERFLEDMVDLTDGRIEYSVSEEPKYIKF